MREAVAYYAWFSFYFLILTHQDYQPRVIGKPIWADNLDLYVENKKETKFNKPNQSKPEFRSSRRQVRAKRAKFALSNIANLAHFVLYPRLLFLCDCPPLTPAAVPDPAAGFSKAATHLMGRITVVVRAPGATEPELQDLRKAELDTH